VKNYLAATILALGVPMILMGDEVRRTQGGNNNAYCHDDESNWLDWSLASGTRTCAGSSACSPRAGCCAKWNTSTGG